MNFSGLSLSCRFLGFGTSSPLPLVILKFHRQFCLGPSSWTLPFRMRLISSNLINNCYSLSVIKVLQLCSLFLSMEQIYRSPIDLVEHTRLNGTCSFLSILTSYFFLFQARTKDTNFSSGGSCIVFFSLRRTQSPHCVPFSVTNRLCCTCRFKELISVSRLTCSRINLTLFPFRFCFSSSTFFLRVRILRSKWSRCSNSIIPWSWSSSTDTSSALVDLFVEQ